MMQPEVCAKGVFEAPSTRKELIQVDLERKIKMPNLSFRKNCLLDDGRAKESLDSNPAPDAIESYLKVSDVAAGGSDS